MASVYVLYINDDIIGPCLELVRKICEPCSTSGPHVTVRGPIKDLKGTEKWKKERISEVKLIEPGNFFSDSKNSQTQNTIYIKCDFKKLRNIWYKPNYGSFIPHITLYDGKSREFAKALWSLLIQYNWGFKIRLKKEINRTTKKVEYPNLSEIRLKSRSSKSSKNEITYRDQLHELFLKITHMPLNYNLLTSLSNKERLKLVCDIYEYLDKKATEQKVRIEDQNDHQEKLRLLYKVHSSNGLRPRELRSKYGQFATPPDLALEMAQYAFELTPRPVPKIHFGDPSIGPGSFYAGLLGIFPKSKIVSSLGVEIDKYYASVARDIWSHSGLKVITSDFLKAGKLPKRNLILTNPPYVRHHFILQEDKKLLQKRVEETLNIKVSGLSNLYVYFILLSHNWMEHGALAEWLVPAEFLEVNYGNAIRHYLTKFVTPIRIHRFYPDKTQFDDALVTSAIVVFRNLIPNDDTLVKFSYGGSLLNPSHVEEVSIDELKKSRKWPAIWQSSHIRKGHSICLGDLFKIKRGIATGANSYFILSRDEAKNLEIPEEFLKPIIPNPRSLSTRIIEAEPDGYPNISPQLSVIDCPLSEEEITQRFPMFWKYLQQAQELGVLERYLVKLRNPWYQQEQRVPPPYLCTYMGRRHNESLPFRFILNRSSAIATNLYLMLYPLEKLTDLLRDDHTYQDVIYDLLCATSESAMLEGGRVYGGGLYKLEPRELASLGADQFIEHLGIRAR